MRLMVCVRWLRYGIVDWLSVAIDSALSLRCARARARAHFTTSPTAGCACYCRWPRRIRTYFCVDVYIYTTEKKYCIKSSPKKMKVWVRGCERIEWMKYNKINVSWGTVCIGVRIAYRIASPWTTIHIGGPNHHAALATLMLFIVFVFVRIKRTRASTLIAVSAQRWSLIFTFCHQILTDSFKWNAINEFLLEHEPAATDQRLLHNPTCIRIRAGAGRKRLCTNKTTDLFTNAFHFNLSWTLLISISLSLPTSECVVVSRHTFTCVTTNRSYVC